MPETPCGECRGEGRVMRKRTWQLDVPAGIESGQRIRVENAGHAGAPGAPAGDLYVQVVVADDERFDRQGQDLVSVAEETLSTRDRDDFVRLLAHVPSLPRRSDRAARALTQRATRHVRPTQRSNTKITGRRVTSGSA